MVIVMLTKRLVITLVVIFGMAVQTVEWQHARITEEMEPLFLLLCHRFVAEMLCKHWQLFRVSDVCLRAQVCSLFTNLW